MFQYKIELYENEQWNELDGWTRPFTDGTTLDDTLDAGKINLSCIKRAEAIKPFTRLRITISEDGEVKEKIQRLVANAQKTLRTYAPSVEPYYDWAIETIELTKLLEREICDSMTVTNALGHDYVSGALPVDAVLLPYGKGEALEREGFHYNKSYQNYTSPKAFGSVLNVFPQQDIFTLPKDGTNYSWSFSAPNSIQIFAPSDSSTPIYNDSAFKGTQINLTEEGTYRIEYTMNIFQNISPPPGLDWGTKYSISVSSVKNVEASEPWTITAVCERLLEAGVTRRMGIDNQKYTLNQEFADKYRDMLAPEFYFTRSTLFEALLQVGGRIHAIPRLIAAGDDDMTLEVTFDELGGDDEVTWDMPPVLYEDKMRSINDFCGTIDSPAQNLLNTQDRIGGAISEPDGEAYITVRAEDAEVEISADTAIIRTTFSIKRVIKVECGYLPDGELVGDITPYIYESSEYLTLSSYWGAAFPYSKAYALRYVQGDNKITQLSFKIKNATTAGTAFNNPAIINIIKEKTGKTIKDTDIINLAFRVTYVPIVTTRISQRKPYTGEYPADNALIYNQSANTAETSFYGEKMKGAIARLGNEAVRRTYDFFSYAQLPKCGQLLDDMYIAKMDTSYDAVKIRSTLTLTKNFNQLAQYVGLNSNFRLYDISEKQSVDRYMLYSENIIIGDAIEEYGGDNMLVSAASAIVGTFTQEEQASAKRITTAVITNHSLSTDKDLTKTILPVVSFPFGNSICFAVSFADNYGAGYQATDEYEDEGNKRVQRLVPYCGGIGEMDTMKVDYYCKAWTASLGAQQDGGFANLYPDYNGGFDDNSKLITTGEHSFIVLKDSREAISHIYQVHAVANRQSIILGSRLTNNNPLVSNCKAERKGVLYFFRNKLNMLDSIIDLSNAVKSNTDIRNLILNTSNKTVLLKGIVNDTGQPMNGWGIIDPTTNMLYIGENVNLAVGETAPQITFTAVDNRTKL